MDKNRCYDVVILGSGPAGLQAAIHAARKRVSVVLLGRVEKSSLFHAHIENFCCIFNAEGEEMLQAGREQAATFGAELLDEDILKLTLDGNLINIKTEDGNQIQGRSLIVATGSTRKMLRVPGEKEFLGRGVSYCVECDANFYRGQDVAVVGSESAGVDGALTMLEYAKTVHLVCDDILVTDMLRKELERSAVITHKFIGVKEIAGKNGVEELVLKDDTRLSVSGVFIELGAKGLLELVTGLGIQLDDEMRFIAADKKQQTNIPGIYAAGDICGPPWQMAKAVGEGCVAGIEASAYARKLKSTV